MNPLAQLLLGSDYASQQGYTSALFNLLDVLLPTNDDPQIDSASGTSLLVYHFDEHHGTGSADLLHPPDVNQIVLSPDNTRLAMRRQSGQVEIYTIATGALERIISPSEPDPEGRRPLAYTRDGRTLVVDFERYDAATGERLTRAANYTQPFDAFTFTSESQLITFGGSPLNSIQESALPWRIWDIESGQLLREDSAIFRGDTTLAVSPDRLRILTETITSESGAELYIVDYRANSAQTIPIPPLANAVIQSIIPNDAWSRFIVVYASNNPSAGNPIAVYTRDGERLYFDAGNNLPRDVFSYGWRDDRTVIIQAYAGVAPTPIIGLAYHPSGLPQCIVDALPDSWQALVPDWERLVYTYLPERVNDIARQLCTALTGEGARNVNAAQGTPVIPADLTAVASLLTPSPTVEYRSARTPAPISVPGVPACITSVYRSQAAAYAELWRQITANVTDPEQLAEINIMICEGLLSSLGGVQPTPTVNPNALVVATPTSPPAGPETTGGDENTFDVMTINVETGARTIASSVVPPGAPDNPDPLALLSTFFYQQYQVYPADPAISPDGRYMAARSRDGFVTIYRLARAVPELVQDEQNAAATRAAQEPRSLGLAPTPSQLPQALGAARPTLTPTVTITPIPFAGMDTTLPQWGESQFVCPARSLAKAPALPGSFAPPGTLIVSPARAYASGDFLWTLDPRTGKLTGDAQRPPCGVSEMCSLSPDGIWLVRQGQAGDVVVSRADGSD
ncbi:MAG: WD40 repeat domain-containing protein, partial [Anaerolineae bacterium]|nr:WD40 repeat domain-containing protein [Anaerolineae bacterium]